MDGCIQCELSGQKPLLVKMKSRVVVARCVTIQLNFAGFHCESLVFFKNPQTKKLR